MTSPASIQESKWPWIRIDILIHMIFIGLGISLIRVVIIAVAISYLNLPPSSSFYGFISLLIAAGLMLLGLLGIAWQMISSLTHWPKSLPFFILRFVNLFYYTVGILVTVRMLTLINQADINNPVTFPGADLFAPMLLLAPIPWFAYFITLVVRFKVSDQTTSKEPVDILGILSND